MRIKRINGITVLDISEDNPEQTLIIAGSGHGKTATMEAIAEAYQNIEPDKPNSKKNFNVIYVTDAKGTLEMAYCQTRPTAKYHKKELNYQKLKFGYQEPKAKQVEIFHPFTFDLPNREIPKMTIFTLPIKDILRKDECEFLLENTKNKTARELMLSTVYEMDDDDTMWDYMKSLEKKTKRKLKKSGNEVIAMYDADNWYLEDTSTGTLKDKNEVTKIATRFKTNFFMQPKKFHHNLNIKEQLFSNPEKTKIISTRYIKDQKTKDFITLVILMQIKENIELSKNPILIIIEEIKELAPAKDSTKYKDILALALRSLFTTHFRGNNVHTLSASQSFSSISPILTKGNAFTQSMIGSLDGSADLDDLKKIYGFSADLIRTITSELRRGEYVMRGFKGHMPEDETMRIFLPPHAHKEPRDKIEEYYKKNELPMFNPSEIKKEMKEYYNLCKKKTGDVVKEIYKKKLKRLREREKEKEDKELEKKQEEIMKEAGKMSKEQQKEIINTEIKRLYKEGKSQSELAKMFKKSQATISRIVKS